jgi:Leucine Rich repeat
MPTTESPASIPVTDKPPCHRRWIPLSLRMFVVMLVLVGVGSTLWIGVPAYRQEVAVREIQEIGGYVTFEDTRPSWMRSLTGEWIVAQLYGEESRFDSSSMKYVAAIPTVDKLDLCGTDVTDAGLPQLRHLTGLRELDLSRLDITDAGIATLEPLNNMASLLLDRTRVTDEGLATVQKMKKLRFLSLADTLITDTGLERICVLSDLTNLDLSHTAVTDAGLVHIKKLKSLMRLELNGTQITDTGLAELAGLTNLRRLGLDETGITDDGITAFRKLNPNVLIVSGRYATDK